MKEKETITISVQEYNQLQRDAQKLEALEKAGVDNWEGCYYAMDYLRESCPEYFED